MDSQDYVEMKGCEVLLENLVAGGYTGPWSEEEEKTEIVKEFLAHRYQHFKDKL